MPRQLIGVIATLLTLGIAAPAAASPAVTMVTPPPPPPAPGATRLAPTRACKPYQRCRPYRHYVRSRPYRYRRYRRYRYRPYRSGRSYRSNRSYRRYRRYRRHRSYRRYRTGRLPYSYRRPYHRHGGPYFGYGVGYLGLIRPTGAYQHLDPLVYLTPYVGWNFNPIFGLELGYNGTILKERDGLLGNVKRPGLFNVTLDLKVRLLQPSRLRYVVPYLQAGLGISFMAGTVKAESVCDDDKNLNMAHGGTISVGGGLDIYLTKWMTIGARALYRPLFMSAMRCGPGADAICGKYSQPFQRLHAWSAEFNVAFSWPG